MSTSPSASAPDSKQPQTKLSDRAALEAAVAGAAGLLLGRVLLGRGAGLAAGTALIGARLYADWKKHHPRPEPESEAKPDSKASVPEDAENPEPPAASTVFPAFAPKPSPLAPLPRALPDELPALAPALQAFASASRVEPTEDSHLPDPPSEAIPIHSETWEPTVFSEKDTALPPPPSPLRSIEPIESNPQNPSVDSTASIPAQSPPGQLRHGPPSTVSPVRPLLLPSAKAPVLTPDTPPASEQKSEQKLEIPTLTEASPFSAAAPAKTQQAQAPADSSLIANTGSTKPRPFTVAGILITLLLLGLVLAAVLASL